MKKATVFSTLCTALLALLMLGHAGAAQASQPPLKVLVFWGSWCANCPAVMRDLDALRQQYAGRNVEFVAVSLEGETTPRKYLAGKGYGFAMKTDGDALLARYQAVGVPWVVVTDAAGNVVANPSQGAAPREVGGLVKLELDLRT